MAKLRQDSKISYQDMLFFDDLGFNIHDVRTLGVFCVHVNDGGVDLALLRNGLESFAQSNLWYRRSTLNLSLVAYSILSLLSRLSYGLAGNQRQVNDISVGVVRYN
ncbi:hypothetical protein ACTXT7_001946 [Hymenolepis weldensis]